MKRAGLILVGVLLLCSLVVGCGGDSGGDQGQQTQQQTESSELTVSAAASLTDAFGELATAFEEQNPGTTVNQNFAGSSTLLTQIQQGAPVDVFASADEAKMDTAVQDGLANEPQTFVRNRPIFITSTASSASIREFPDIAQPGSRLVLEQDDVPIAEYAKEILSNANSAYGDDFEQRVFDNIVSREQDVKASAQRVALGEADGTFVYASDVTPDIQNSVETVQIPEELNVIATYPIATLKGSQNPELAQRWVDFVLSDQGQSVLESYGFIKATGS